MRKISLLMALSTSLILALTARTTLAADAGMEADVALTPAGDFKAKTDDVKGEAIADGDTIHAENITVNMKSIKTGLSLRDKHAKEKYLEVDKYPEAVLVKAIGKGGKGKARIRFRGIEKDVDGTYKIDGSMLVAEFPLKLSDFGISGIKYMGVGVDDVSKVHVTVPLKKK